MSNKCAFLAAPFQCIAISFTLMSAQAFAAGTQALNLTTASAATVNLLDSWAERPLVVLLAFALGMIVLVMATYGVRHITFTLSRLFGGQRYPYAGIQTAVWPQLTVFVAAHNEEKVIAGCLEALLDTDYPPERIRIVPVNDRSTDGTKAIVDAYVARYPERIVPFHRTGGKPGKAAALKDAMAMAEGDIAIICDDMDAFRGQNQHGSGRVSCEQQVAATAKYQQRIVARQRGAEQIGQCGAVMDFDQTWRGRSHAEGVAHVQRRMRTDAIRRG